MKSKQQLKKEFDQLILTVNSCQADNPEINRLIRLVQRNFELNKEEAFIEYSLIQLRKALEE